MQRVVSHHATRSAAHNPSKGILFAVGLPVLSLVLPRSAARAQCAVFYVGLNGGYGCTADTSDITYLAIAPSATFLVSACGRNM